MNIVDLIKSHRPDIFTTPDTSKVDLSDEVTNEDMLDVDSTPTPVEKTVKPFDYEKGYNELLAKIDSMTEKINSLTVKGEENV